MTTLSMKLWGKLPNGDGDGLTAIADDLDKDRKRIRVALMLFDVDEYVERTDDGTASLRVRVRRVEAIQDPDDAAAMERILMREFERRTGQTTLPIDLEGDVQAAFEHLRAEMPAVGDGARSWEPGQSPAEKEAEEDGSEGDH